MIESVSPIVNEPDAAFGTNIGPVSVTLTEYLPTRLVELPVKFVGYLVETDQELEDEVVTVTVENDAPPGRCTVQLKT